MNIYYLLSDYISHRKAGEAYIACLRDLGHTLVETPETSDLVIVHDGPHRYADLLRDIPRRPGRKVVGYAVWETPQLPAQFIEGVRQVDTVLTCSDFSRRAFAPYVETLLLPHVVERPRVAGKDMAWALARLGMETARREDRDLFYFYTIMDTVNPRKNAPALFSAFAAAFPEKRDRVRLVVKQYRKSLNLDAFPFVINIPELLTDGQISALHAVCDAYVGTHHAEAWGLPLSEALSFGNPVVATGYSGNMEFMTERNSFPVPYTVVPVSGRMCQALPELFTAEMTWADIDMIALMRTLRHVRARPVSPEFRDNAAASMNAFFPAAICERLRDLLAVLV